MWDGDGGWACSRAYEETPLLDARLVQCEQKRRCHPTIARWHFCDMARSRIDLRFQLKAHLLQHTAKKAHFCDRHHIASATAALVPELSPAHAGLLCLLRHRWGAFRKAWAPSNQWLGGWLGESGGWFMDNVLSLQLARKRASQPRGGSMGHAVKRLGLPRWNSETTGLDARSTSNQRFLDRLEAENAQLRGSVVELMLQIQALRDRAETLTA
jgi:hypothetical protein